MTLVLSEGDVSRLSSFRELVDALEEAFRELGEGIAASRPRTDTSVVHPSGDRIYRFKSMDGVLPRARVAGLRVNSDTVLFRTAETGDRRFAKVAPMCGMHVSFIMVFDIETGEPLAILPDRNVQRMRVACTSGLAARHLARADSRVLGVVGSGWQAGAMVHAMCAVRSLEQVRVYSPNPEHRERFAAQLADEVDVPHEATRTMAEAVRGADIVAVCTNSRDAFFGWDLVEPGMHLTTIRFPNMRTEVFHRSDVVVTNQRPPAYFRPAKDCYPYLHDYVGTGVDTTLYAEDPRLDPDSPEFLDFSQFDSLGEMLVGRGPVRRSERDVTFHVNNIGVGIQFASVGKLLYDKARAQGLGSEIPTEMFLSYQPPMSI